VKIDAEFKALIAPLQPDERQQLEENLVAHGCRDALVVWRDTLIDGHNRHEICERRRIKYRTVEMALASREHVLLWIEENQLGRRNLTDDQRATIVESVVERKADLSRAEQLKKAREQRGKPKPSVVAAASTTTPTKQRIRTELSKRAQVSERKVKAIRAIKKVKPAALAEIRAGEKTILEVKAEIKTAEKAAVARQIAAEAPQYPDGPFRVIVVDPPWKYQVRGEDTTHRARNPYPDMTLEEIHKLRDDPVALVERAHKDCVLWLWTTNGFLYEAFGCLTAWGFTYKTMLTWVKDRMGTGDWLRGQTEHCLMAIRGKPTIMLTNQTTVLHGPLREHSRKPDEFYALVEALCPGNKWELFARAQRAGWTTSGAEAQKFEAVS
jgi:N6-adenosine-specific RNA methylase IME4